MMAVFGFAGLSIRDDGIALDPRSVYRQVAI
jgi:hypothetical protein